MKDITEQKNAFMRIALEEAKIAFDNGEIPVGALIVKDGEIIARAHNINRSLSNPVKHAEIICIEEASRALSNERLLDCDLYVTSPVQCARVLLYTRE
jgi:tRNA(adenine34) deaminase